MGGLQGRAPCQASNDKAAFCAAACRVLCRYEGKQNHRMATDEALEQPARPHLNERRMIDEPVTSTLVRFSIPLLLTNLMMALSGSWGAIWVSHVLGPNALTAVVNA